LIKIGFLREDSVMLTTLRRRSYFSQGAMNERSLFYNATAMFLTAVVTRT